MKPDKKIWDDFRHGENYALSHIYFQYIQMLYRYGKKFSQDDELVKDVIQDLFFDLIRTKDNLGETDNISFYLMASFRRKLARAIKQRLPLEYSDDNELTAEIVYSAEHDFIHKEVLSQREKTIKNALLKLTPKQREVLFYKFTCNFDYEQICEIMELQYNSARKQVSRALKALKEVLPPSELFLFFTGFTQK
ncbi:RNA polymerase sigma factor, sigma-70 family [Mariniphaga anaerophila]|uniref:RNA polymerase sigma factor, sigma-70 family n=1 Tax=Mariniphaga anaerophila TaxID=1484053 RepID=A0A1M4T4Z6_9BACT|nr:sigma-70 family RNA polymerase sigma factor [Mariniphaga anaerophila]SHE39613.1 RNA polymerase sigma factor, sigma-70 family [Mariniphaga anaerophila]